MDHSWLPYSCQVSPGNWKKWNWKMETENGNGKMDVENGKGRQSCCEKVYSFFDGLESVQPGVFRFCQTKTFAHHVYLHCIFELSLYVGTNALVLSLHHVWYYLQ